MAGVDLGYDSDGLRSGGREALGAGEAAAGAAGTLRGATCPASALGVVAGAEALAAALARTRDTHVALAEGVDPRAEAARVAGADPGTVAGAGALLGRGDQGCPRAGRRWRNDLVVPDGRTTTRPCT